MNPINHDTTGWLTIKIDRSNREKWSNTVCVSKYYSTEDVVRFFCVPSRTLDAIAYFFVKIMVVCIMVWFDVEGNEKFVSAGRRTCCYITTLQVFSMLLTQILGVWLVEKIIATNHTPKIWVNRIDKVWSDTPYLNKLQN